ncbi:DUF2332 domain-containing protein [Klenkia brasiliensis]|uniref:DUF2332 domain-containing protein n=1 Tax=Klenkia brasiliensis TaxID=333142 RepID=A0A1G7Q4U9_9ACTN|nr:DUF2332 domain-containing protein [Klenkia brasiliensis]SDF93572.1 hypothetical protein SAMN05660324_1354 [Klenkia brasiliensis]
MDRDDLAARYLRFAEVEAAVASPHYAALARAVAADPVVLDLLLDLPRTKRQPNLLFAVLRLLGGVPADGAELHDRVVADEERVRAEVLARATQTNEPARAASLLPALARVEGPLALVEVGCSAGLLLQLDRYGYAYRTATGVHRVRPDAGLVLECSVDGSVALPDDVPQVVHRVGVDRNPLDPADPDTVAWLRALVWPGPQEQARLARLGPALELAAAHPHERVTGDLVEQLPGVLAGLPAGATPVVLASMTLVYLDDDARAGFADATAGVRVVAAEAPGVVVDVPPDPHGRVVVSLDGEPLLLAAPHGGAVTAV